MESVRQKDQLSKAREYAKWNNMEAQALEVPERNGTSFWVVRSNIREENKTYLVGHTTIHMYVYFFDARC